MFSFIRFKTALLAVFVGLLTANAQNFDLQAPIPTDTAITTGVLPNGMRYYLRYNAKPEKRVEFRLAVKAGSICETDQQKGLAHFVEHMCFNGTKTFKENDLVNILEEMGVRFGNDLNAQTGFDETIYKLQVPSDRSDLIDKAFQIMEDWAHQVSFTDKAIDDERGVIVEEWRLGLGAQDRMQRKYLPVIFNNSRYAQRLPIGDMEIVKNAPYEQLRKFYHDWYRPNLMALAVVGDMPLKTMKEQFEKHFTNLKNPDNAPKRETYQIPNNKEPLVCIATDKEATQNVIEMFIKHPQKKETTVGDYRESLLTALYNRMISARFDELMQKPDAPFMYAGASYGRFIGPVDVYDSYALAKENEIGNAFSALLAENERVKRFGFTNGELERAKQELLTSYESQAKEVGKQNSASLVNEYVRNFTDDEPIPGITCENAYAKHFVPDIKLDEVNALAKQWITDENVCIVVMAPEKEGVTTPTEAEILKILADSKTAPLTAYADETLDQPLLPNPPTGTGLLIRKDDETFGTTELTFKNGVKVTLKPTDFKNDEIIFAGISAGGTSVYTDEDYMSAMMSATIVSQGGLGDFDLISLNKKLAGNTASLSPYISDLFEGVRGSTTPKDLETMLQLNYLYFTAPRRDEEAFKAYISRIRNQVVNMKSNPLYAFIDTVSKIATCNDPRTIVIPTEQQIDRISLDHAMRIFTDRFDASDFRFFMVGNFKITEVMPLLEKYIGGLPVTKRVDNWRDVSSDFPKGIVRFNDKKNSEQQSQVMLMMQGDFVWKYKEQMLIGILADILKIKLRESMREEQGGVYGVSVSVSEEPFPKPKYVVSIGWGCAPTKADTLVTTLFGEIAKVKAKGPTDTDLAKVKETMIRNRETNLKDNGWWLGKLQNTYSQNVPLMTFEAYKKMLNSISVKDIRKTAVKYLNEGNYVLAKLLPKEEVKEPSELTDTSETTDKPEATDTSETTKSSDTPQKQD